MRLLITLGALAFALGDVVFVLLLVVRRVRLARADRRRSAAEQRLRPLALAIADGEAAMPPSLPPGEAEVLASLLARYAQWLSGSSREAIARWFETHGEVERTLRGLSSRRAWRRAAAAHALGDMGSTIAAAALCEALRDPVRDVRAAAARSLGCLGSAGAVPDLVRALAAHAVPRAVGAQALLAIGGDAVEPLRMLAADPDAELAATAVELVALIGDAADGRWLQQILAHGAAPVRAAAAFALGRLGDEDEALALCRTLNDPDARVRRASADALRAIGDLSAVPALLAAAREGDFDTARAAAVAVARIAPDALRAEARRRPGEPHLQEAGGVLALAEP